MPAAQLIAIILGGLLLLALLIRRTVGKVFLYRMIFETDTPAGKTFDVVLLLSIVPSFLGLLASGAQVFLVVRMLRVMRVFRVLKLGEYLKESNLLWEAIVAGRRKISVFLLAMITLVTLIGSWMYVIEGPQRGFRSIPVGIYWAIVTITTVGYGDVTPQTTLGRFLASVVMLLGYSIIAIPTGIISAEIGQASARQREES